MCPDRTVHAGRRQQRLQLQPQVNQLRSLEYSGRWMSRRSRAPPLLLLLLLLSPFLLLLVIGGGGGGVGHARSLRSH